MEETLKILLIHVSGRIGDSLMATPAIYTVSKAFKNAKIDLLVHRNRVDLFQNIPNVNLIGSISEKRAWYKGWLSIKKYDYVIVFNHGNELINIISYASRVGKKVIASRTENPKINAKLFKVIPRLDNHIKAYLNYLSPLKIKKSYTKVKVFLTKDEIFFAKSLLKKNDLLSKFIVGYQIVSFPTRSYRDWPIENFITLSKKIIHTNPNVFFVVFGGIEDQKKVGQFIECLPQDQCLNLSGKLSLRQTAAVMSMIDLYIGVDTGPSHMMSAFNVPMVCLYHSTCPSMHLAPIGHSKFFAIDHPKKSKATVSDSMDSILVNTVFKKINFFLKNDKYFYKNE